MLGAFVRSVFAADSKTDSVKPNAVRVACVSLFIRVVLFPLDCFPRERSNRQMLVRLPCFSRGCSDSPRHTNWEEIPAIGVASENSLLSFLGLGVDVLILPSVRSRFRFVTLGLGHGISSH